MRTLTTTQMVAQLVASIAGPRADHRQLHILNQSLLGLVRLAKIEQRIDIKRSVDKSIATSHAGASRRAMKKLIEGAKHSSPQEELKFK